MNFQKLITEIIARGMTQRVIARKSGLNESQVFKLRKGIQKDVFYTPGAKLVALGDDLGIRIE